MISVKELLITPEHFFGEICKQEVSLKIPVIIIILVGLISGISAYIIAGKTTAAFVPSGMEGITLIASAIGFIGGLIGSFFSWIIWVIAFWILLYILKGNRSFKRIAEIVAYGFIPQIFGGIISTAIVLTSLPALVVTSTNNIQEIENVMKAFTTSAPMLAVTFIGIIFTLWSAYIWIFGIEKSSNLDFKKSAICVIIPVLAFILLTTSSIFL